MDQGGEGEHVSALDFDIVRAAFLRSVRELKLTEDKWADHVRLLFHELTDHIPDDAVVTRVIGRLERPPNGLG